MSRPDGTFVYNQIASQYLIKRVHRVDYNNFTQLDPTCGPNRSFNNPLYVLHIYNQFLRVNYKSDRCCYQFEEKTHTATPETAGGVISISPLWVLICSHLYVERKLNFFQENLYFKTYPRHILHEKSFRGHELVNEYLPCLVFSAQFAVLEKLISNQFFLFHTDYTISNA